jgi:replicative DNA helicase
MQDNGPQAYSLETERYLLSACLQWPSTIDELADYIDKDDWYLEKHMNAWQALLRLSVRRDAINYLSLFETLRAQGHSDEWDGIDEIVKLRDFAPTRARIKKMALIVSGLARVRRVTEEAMAIAVQGRSGEYGDVEDFIEQAESRITAATQGRKLSEITTLAESVNKTMNWLSSLESQKLAGFGINTTFNKMDEWTSGFQGGDLIIIAAPTSFGKTALAMQIALKAGKPVLYCALEQSRKQLALRCMSARSGVPMYKMRNPTYWGKNTASRLLDAVHKLERIQMHLDDRPKISPIQMRSVARRLYRQHRLSLIIGDYLQIFKPSIFKKGQNRERDVADMSSEFKEIGRELDLPIIMLSQMNRGWNARADKRPILADLRESGSLEQDADQVIFIHRPNKPNGYSEEPEPAEIILAKNRNGPCGTVNATWYPKLMHFIDKEFNGEVQSDDDSITPDASGAFSDDE